MEDRLEGAPVREAGRLMQSSRQERLVAWTRVIVGKWREVSHPGYTVEIEPTGLPIAEMLQGKKTGTEDEVCGLGSW